MHDRTMIRLGRAAIAAAALIAIAAPALAQMAPNLGLRNALRACVAEKRVQFVWTRPFQSPELTLTCPSADVVGFPPRERRHERNELVTYAAPEGYRVVAGSAALCGAPNASSSPVTVSADGLRAQTPLSCRGGGVGAAPITVSARICGQEQRVATPDIEKQWLVECGQALAARR